MNRFLAALLMVFGAGVNSGISADGAGLLPVIVSGIKALSGKEYSFERKKVTYFPTGNEKKTDENIVIEFLDLKHFKYARKSIIGNTQDDANLFYAGDGKYFTENVNRKSVTITRFSPRALNKSLCFHPAFLLPEGGGVKERVEGKSRVLSVKEGIYSYEIKFGGGGGVTSVLRSKSGVPEFEYAVMEEDKVGFPVKFRYKEYYKGKLFTDEVWSLKNIRTLSGEERESSNFNYFFKPGFRVFDRSAGKTTTFSSDELLNFDKKK